MTIEDQNIEGLS